MATQEVALPQYPEVFINNYRGAELRYGFVSHLKRTLKRNGVNVYDGQELVPEAPIENIFKVIEELRIAIVIFSSRYTKSKRCLEELVRIKELVEQRKLVVIPVFYKLTVIEVKNLTGEFGDNFWDLAKPNFGPGDKIEKWMKALKFVSQTMGLVFNEKSDNEANFINCIVEHVKIVITRISPKQIEKAHNYWLSELQEDNARDGILWDINSEEAEIFQPEAKSSKDDGLNLSKGDNFLGEAYSHPTVVERPPNHQVLRYGFLSNLVKALISYEIIILRGMIIGCLLLLFLTTSSYSPMDGKVKPPNIPVFINFRGNLRTSFVGSLVTALQRSGIDAYIDIQEQRGEDLDIIYKRIEGSGIAIVVFSSGYTESDWCLNELMMIKERVHQGKLKVLPIYFKLTPENVKRLKGEFGDHFRDKEYWYRSDEPKIKLWKEAIVFVSHRFALTYDEKSSVWEIHFIETIVEEILKMLQALSTVESFGR